MLSSTWALKAGVLYPPSSSSRVNNLSKFQGKTTFCIAAIQMSIIDQDDYATRHWSPMLSAVHPMLEPSQDFVLENNYSDVDEYLDIV